MTDVSDIVKSKFSLTDMLGLGWVKWALAGLAVVAALAAIKFYNDSLREEGRAEVVAKQLDEKVKALETAQAETERLTKANKEIQDAYIDSKKLLDDYDQRMADANRRLRELRKQFDAKVGSSTPDSVRDYAAACSDNFDRSRSHVERFGREAASCSTAAEALKKSNDLLSRQQITNDRNSLRSTK